MTIATRPAHDPFATSSMSTESDIAQTWNPPEEDEHQEERETGPSIAALLDARIGWNSPPPTIPETPDPDRDDPAEQLRQSTAAVRVSFTWFGTKRALEKDQKQQMAETCNAQGDSITAGKKLVNTKHSAYQAVTKIRTKILEDWRDSSLPFPEPGIRLIRQADIAGFQSRMETARLALLEAVGNLDEHFGEIQEEARQRLGTLFNPSDYPSTLIGLFAVSWEFPSVEPPSYLMQLQPAIYEQERARVAAQFDEAVRLAEEAFTQQFAEAITHLCARLGRDENGDALVFRATAITNLTDFFERFRTLNVRSNPQLDQLVNQARAAVRGTSARSLRTSTSLRETVARDLAQVAATLETLTVTRPRRAIQRGARPQEGANS